MRLGSIAPDFCAETTHGPIRFHEWLDGQWAVLFSHPDDFTPVCTTELGQVARLEPEFRARSVKIIGASALTGISANTLESHHAWSDDIRDVSGGSVTFPIIADADRHVATLYDMLDALDPTNRDALGMPLTGASRAHSPRCFLH